MSLSDLFKEKPPVVASSSNVLWPSAEKSIFVPTTTSSQRQPFPTSSPLWSCKRTPSLREFLNPNYKSKITQDIDVIDEPIDLLSNIINSGLSKAELMESTRKSVKTPKQTTKTLCENTKRAKQTNNNLLLKDKDLSKADVGLQSSCGKISTQTTASNSEVDLSNDLLFSIKNTGLTKAELDQQNSHDKTPIQTTAISKSESIKPKRKNRKAAPSTANVSAVVSNTSLMANSSQSTEYKELKTMESFSLTKSGPQNLPFTKTQSETGSVTSSMITDIISSVVKDQEKLKQTDTPENRSSDSLNSTCPSTQDQTKLTEMGNNVEKNSSPFIKQCSPKKVALPSKHNDHPISSDGHSNEDSDGGDDLDYKDNIGNVDADNNHADDNSDGSDKDVTDNFDSKDGIGNIDADDSHFDCGSDGGDDDGTDSSEGVNDHDIRNSSGKEDADSHISNASDDDEESDDSMEVLVFNDSDDDDIEEGEIEWDDDDDEEQLEKELGKQGESGNQPTTKKKWKRKRRGKEKGKKMQRTSYSKVHESRKKAEPIKHENDILPVTQTNTSRKASESKPLDQQTEEDEGYSLLSSLTNTTVDVTVAASEKDLIKKKTRGGSVSAKKKKKLQKRMNSYFARRANEMKQAKQREPLPPRVCHFYLRGCCTKGAECPFRHEGTPVKIQEVCKYYLVDSCNKGDTCPFLHNSFPCKYHHSETASCCHGNRCKFSHDPLTPETQAMLDKFLSDQKMRQESVLLQKHERPGNETDMGAIDVSPPKSALRDDPEGDCPVDRSYQKPIYSVRYGSLAEDDSNQQELPCCEVETKSSSKLNDEKESLKAAYIVPGMYTDSSEK